MHHVPRRRADGKRRGTSASSPTHHRHPRPAPLAVVAPDAPRTARLWGDGIAELMMRGGIGGDRD